MAIAIIGMLDEREPALTIIKEQIERRGHATLLVDISIGTGATVPTLKADIKWEEVLRSAERARGTKETPAARADTLAPLMAEGLRRTVSNLHRAGKIEGIIAIAGMTGTLISLKAMKELPYGVPKLLISSAAAMPAHAEQLAEYFGSRDVTVMHTVIDTVGMNSMVRTLAVNGANAISGMVEARGIAPATGKPSIAITEFGFCDKGAHYIREILEESYEIVSFHSTGIGDGAAREFVKQGFFEGFIDLVPGTFSEHLLGGNRASGPDRLDIAADNPIPYILCPGGFDMISCGPIERREKKDALWTSRELGKRKLHVQDALRVQARVSRDEMEQIGFAVAERLNRYDRKERVRVVIPLRGFSSLSVEGGPLYDPASDAAFALALKERLDCGIKVIEVDTDINSREFAIVVADAFVRACPKGPHRSERPSGAGSKDRCLTSRRSRGCRSRGREDD